MKTSFIVPLTSLFVSLGAVASPAPAPSPSSVPGDTTSELDAQMAITRRGVEELLGKTGRSGAPFSLKAADYQELAPAFRKNVETALADFEENLKKEVLGPDVGSLMDSYNSVVASSSISEAQKKMILQQQMAYMKSQAKEIESRYAKIVERAFLETGLTFYALRLSSTSEEAQTGMFPPPVDRGFRKACKRAGYGKLSEGGMNIALIAAGASDFSFCTSNLGSSSLGYTFDFRELTYETDSSGNILRFDGFRGVEGIGEKVAFKYFPSLVPVIVNQFRTGCRSRLCVSLRAADAVTILDQMQSLFSRDITLKLADGESFTIRAPSTFPWRWTLPALKMTGLYGIDDLPFDTN